MIVYLDASALVKRYVFEAGSTQVNHLLAQVDVVGTAAISRAKVVAALAKSARMGVVDRSEAEAALQAFRAEWVDLVRLPLTEAILAQADTLAWEHGLRGYDAVHLATACFWQLSLGEPMTLATYDRQLWQTGKTIGLTVWPTEGIL